VGTGVGAVVDDGVRTPWPPRIGRKGIAGVFGLNTRPPGGRNTGVGAVAADDADADTLRLRSSAPALDTVRARGVKTDVRRTEDIVGSLLSEPELRDVCLYESEYSPVEFPGVRAGKSMGRLSSSSESSSPSVGGGLIGSSSSSSSSAADRVGKVGAEVEEVKGAGAGAGVTKPSGGRDSLLLCECDCARG
jgi:hypothetical protein